MSVQTGEENYATKGLGDHFTWDEYFMVSALTTAQKSKDPSTKVGTCIADKKNHIIGLGYNGFPRGINDDYFPQDRKGKLHETKYAYVVHAESNAILNSIGDLEGARLYATLFPCNECSKQIIQVGIEEVVYLSDKYHDTDFSKASRTLLELADIKTRQFVPGFKRVENSFSSILEEISKA